MPSLVLSSKFKDFLRVRCKREFLEGTTAAGKTTVGIAKFMLMVASSTRKDHVIAGADIGTVEKNIINSELGLLAQFDGLAEYHPSGKGKTRLPHVSFKSPNGNKVVYVCGYDNKAKWKKVLGSQMGCVFVDEVNIADMEFLREITHRCDYMMTTNNPDDPTLSVFKEFINKSRPLKKYVRDYPKELLDELKEPYVNGWVHWYFTFYDNASLSQEAIQKKIDSVPIGTKMYKNKIQGLRGRATGRVFPNFDKKKHLLNWRQAKEFNYKRFSVGVDTSYSAQSEDTMAFIFQGITTTGEIVILDEEVRNNKDLTKPLAPSDIVPSLFSFVERNAKEWGIPECIFIDNADAATITECNKFLASRPQIYNVAGSWKKMHLVDRIHLQLGWFQDNKYLVLSHCTHHVHELEVYSWKEDKYEPEDRNDHTINASQYGFIPYKNMIGGK